MMSVDLIVLIQLSFVQFSSLCYEFCLLSKTECRASIVILGMTMKAVAFESQPEINRFVEKLVIFFVISLLYQSRPTLTRQVKIRKNY